jgi:hypothetical protein
MNFIEKNKRLTILQEKQLKTSNRIRYTHKKTKKNQIDERME